MIRLKLNNGVELLCNNTNKFDPKEIIKPAKISALRAFGIDNKALSAEYQDAEGKISSIELIRVESPVEKLEPKSVVEVSLMKDIRHILKKTGKWSKCNETILHFQ